MSLVRVELQHPAWARAANIYEVNIRQYTPEGTLAAFAQHLPRLKAMGVDILWLMPIQPIGQLHRKGTLGSNYSVSDYVAVNPEFGTLEEFRQLVREVHALGMHILLDWVANHTAWDHGWATQHPDWYKKNAAGDIHSYEYDNGREIEYWTDVIGLDYRQPALWTGMIDALTFWVRETGIDGYRCDVAGLVPTPFWERARAELDAIKPVFMLAEWSDPALHRQAFDMTYDWDLYDVMTKIAAGRGDARELAGYVERRYAVFEPDAYRMSFTTNHDKNSWEGHDGEKFGPGFRAFAVLAATLPGMPLIYSGQESGLDKRLAFFEKDPIDWKDYALADFYASLLRLKHDNPCLWNGRAGGDLTVLPGSDAGVFAFRRSVPGNAVTVHANLTNDPRSLQPGASGAALTLPPWGYHVERA